MSAVTKYAGFWLVEDDKWYATVERDGVEIWRRGPFATEAEAKDISDKVVALMERYSKKAWGSERFA